MKFSPYLLCLFLSLLCITSFAQPTNGSKNVLARSCNAISLEFGWQDGQAIPLKKVQKIIHTMTLPKGYSIRPKSAIRELANMDINDVPQVVFNCTSDVEDVPPNTVAKFYFSYLLPDNTLERTPEFVVTKDVMQ